MPLARDTAGPSSEEGQAAPSEAILTADPVDLHSELIGSLERIEAMQRHWGDPLDERSGVRRALRAELRAFLSATDLDGPHGAGVATRTRSIARADSQREGASPLPRSASDSPLAGPPPQSHSVASVPVGAVPSQVSSLADEVSKLNSSASPWSSAIAQPTRWQSRNNSSWRCDILETPEPPRAMSASSGPVGRMQLHLWRLVHKHGRRFDAVIGLLIVANSICVGVEIQCGLDGSAQCSKITHDLEHVFLVAFVLELIIRACADGMDVLQSGWFRFDAILVVIGIISSWVMEPIMLIAVDDGGSVIVDILSLVLVLRLLRLIRLVRALRLFQQFREMWKVASGFMAALRTVVSACILIVLTVYVFACLGIELITRNSSLREDPVTATLIKSHFSSLHVTMLTLVQFANTDSIAAVYKPILERAWYLVFYFGLVWLVVTVMAWNLITALIVDTAIVQGESDREFDLAMKRKRLKTLEPCMRALFQELDEFSEGMLSLKDFRSRLEMIDVDTLKDFPADLRNILQSDQLLDVCEVLDADGSGEIDETEFIDGIFSLVFQSVPIETTQILQLLRTQGDVMQRIQRKIQATRR